MLENIEDILVEMEKERLEFKIQDEVKKPYTIRQRMLYRWRGISRLCIRVGMWIYGLFLKKSDIEGALNYDHGESICERVEKRKHSGPSYRLGDMAKWLKNL